MLQSVLKRHNKTTKRHFGLSPTQEMKHEWGSKETESKKLEKDKRSFCKHTAKRPQLKTVVENWTTGKTVFLCLQN
jgi:hypothetical protein